MSGFASVLNSAIVAISDTAFRVASPSIQPTTWSSILYDRHKPVDAENERLEFIGDALIYLCVALDVYERYPHATPGFLTDVRQPLVTNLVLSLLAEKIDHRAARMGSVLQPVLSVRKQVIDHGIRDVKTKIPKNVVKASADTMEMALGALYFEKGFHAVREWVTNTYDPLIMAATKALGGSTTYKASKKRGNAETSDDTQRPNKRLRSFHSRRSEPEATSHTPLPVPSLEKVFIDLTGDSEGVDDEVRSPASPTWIDLTLEDDDDDKQMDLESSLPAASTSRLPATVHSPPESHNSLLLDIPSGSVYSNSSDDASIASRTEVQAALGNVPRRSLDDDSEDEIAHHHLQTFSFRSDSEGVEHVDVSVERILEMDISTVEDRDTSSPNHLGKVMQLGHLASSGRRIRL